MRVSPNRPHLGLCVVLLAMLAGSIVAQAKKPTIPVFGVVRGEDGKPVAGATVREVRLSVEGADGLTATRLGLGPRYESSATTNARGRFVLRVSAHGVFGIVAVLDGQRSQVIAPAAPAGQHQLQLRKLISVKGRCVDVEDGKDLAPYARIVRSTGPIESAVPGAFAIRALAVVDEVRSNDRGEFEVKTLAGAHCRLTDPWGNCRIDVPEVLTQPLVLRREVRSVRGKVVDTQTQKPIGNYTLHLAGTQQAANADGSFAVRVPNKHRLRITAPGYLPAQLAAAPQIPAGQERVVLMTPTHKAVLHVLGDTGQPAVAARIVTLEIAASEQGSSVLVLQHVADQAGRLELSRPGKYGASVFLQKGNQLVRILELATGTEDAELTVPTATFDMRGTILDCNGTPAAHVPIYASPCDPVIGSRWPLANRPVAFTDHAGKFTIPALANLPYMLASRSPRSHLTIVSGLLPKEAGPIKLQLEQAQMVTGRVLSSKGKPVEGIEVSVRLLTTDDLPRRYHDFGIWASTALSDAKGLFALPLIAPNENHFVGINPLQRLASQPTVVNEATEDVLLELK